MDLSLITGAYASLRAAKEIGATLVEMRDFNQVASTVTRLNSELLKAQDGLFAYQAQMLELQTRQQELLKEVEELRKRVSERARYDLVEVVPGIYAYRLKELTQGMDGFAIDRNEPVHYVCQPCMDVRNHRGILGRKSVLGGGSTYLQCPLCNWRCPSPRSGPGLIGEI